MLNSIKTLSAVFLFMLIFCSRTVSGAPLLVDLMITNGLVVTMDAGMTVIENGSVVITLDKESVMQEARKLALKIREPRI
jgi:hypothetical protein